MRHRKFKHARSLISALILAALFAGLIPPPMINGTVSNVLNQTGVEHQAALEVLADVLPAPSSALAAGTITGTVFNDSNINGTNDGPSEPGIAGVTVTAYDASGAAVGTATTDANGTYSLAATGTGPYRIEFTGIPSTLKPSVAGTGSGSTVQFVPDGDSSGVDLGLHSPADYCQDNQSIDDNKLLCQR